MSNDIMASQPARGTRTRCLFKETGRDSSPFDATTGIKRKALGVLWTAVLVKIRLERKICSCQVRNLSINMRPLTYLKGMELNVLTGVIEIFRNDDIGDPFIIKVTVIHRRPGALSWLLDTSKWRIITRLTFSLVTIQEQIAYHTGQQIRKFMRKIHGSRDAPCKQP